MQRRFRSAIPTTAVLVAVYLFSVFAHLYLLRQAYQFPHISSDEVQYAMTGENIRLGHGYMLRGQFNSSLPPVFPLVIALAPSAGADPRAALFILSCLLMCSAIFPVNALGKLIGLEAGAAMILAAAASLLPHTFYAATYMAETVQYPAFLTACYLAIRWLDAQSWVRDVTMGCAMGILLLTKVQASQFVGAFLIAGVIIAFRSGSGPAGSPRRFVAHFGAVLVTTSAIEGAWSLYKSAHSGTVLGQYGRILAEQGLSFWTPRLTLAYVADFLLAPGLITVVLLFYWIRYNGNWSRTVFVTVLLAVQLIAVSTLDGGLTGWLRERLFIYALPITAVLSAKGVTYFKSRQTLAAECALVVVPAVLIVALLAYPFAVSSVVEVPWANAMGSLAELLPFSRVRLWIASSILAVVMALILMRSFKNAVPAFGAYLVFFNGLAFASSSFALTRWTARDLASVSPIMSWLRANHVRSGDRLLTAGRHAYFENPALRAAPVDTKFLDWTWRNGLGEDVEWQIETIGRFDVRMIPAPQAIPAEARPGDFLLTVARFDTLSVPSSHDDLQLYRMDHVPEQAPSPKYFIHIPAARFHTRGTKQTSDLIYVPALGLGPGTYEVTFEATTATTGPLSFEVTGKADEVLVKKTAASAKTSASFAHAAGPVAFRAFGDSQSASRFEGVDVEWISKFPQHARPEDGFVPDGVFTATEPEDLVQARSHSGAACYIDLLGGVPSAPLRSGDRQWGAKIAGWAVDIDDRLPADEVYVHLSSKSGMHYWARAHRYPRPDLAKAGGNAALADSGLKLSADVQFVEPGIYDLKIVLLNGVYARECDPRRELSIH